MRCVLCVMLSLMVGACSTLGAVEMRGQFESASAQEVRYFLDYRYGYSALDMALTPPEPREPSILYTDTDASGSFQSEVIPVWYSSPPFQPPPPAFWVGFSNERELLYGVGGIDGKFDFRTYHVDMKVMVNRDRACWIIHSGELERPDDRRVVMSFVVSPEPCHHEKLRRAG